MAITYTGTGGLFTILGQAFGAHASLNTVRTTTIKGQVQQFVDAYKAKTNATLQFDRAIHAAAAAELTWRRSGDTLATQLQRDVQGLLTEVIKADSPIVFRGQLADALEYLIADMVAEGYWVTSNIVSGSYAADVGNSATDLALFVSVTDHLSKTLQMALAEDIEVLCTSGGVSIDQAAIGALRYRGERQARSKLSEEFPAGSNVEKTLKPLYPSDSLLTNGGFQDATIEDIPDGWIVGVGEPGANITLTAPESQTITITGSPSAGTYAVQLTDPITGLQHRTESLDYDASGDTLQTALRAVTGLAVDLSEITVTTTGTPPNYVHTVEFIGVAGNLALMTVANNTGLGSFAIAEVTAGTNFAIRGRALKFHASGSVLQSVYQRVVLEPDKVYFLGYWITPSTTPTQGVLFAGVSDEIVPASTIPDHTGGAIGDVVDLTLIASKTGRGVFFSVPPTAPSPLYVCFEKSTAEPTADIYIDEVVLVEATQLYPGGPYVAALQGKQPPAANDLFTLTMANDYSETWHVMFDSFFDMTGKRLSLPTSGSTNIPTALIA